MIAEFKATHFEMFFGDSKICLATIREFLMGKSTSAGPARGSFRPAPKDAGDPTTLSALEELVIGVRASVVSATGKSMIHITKDDKLFVSSQVDHGVLRGQKICLCGGGKFRLASEMDASVEGRIALMPQITSDETMLLYQDVSKVPREERYVILLSVLNELRASGKMSQALMPFHVITTIPGSTPQERVKYDIVPTKERMWISTRGAKCAADNKSAAVACTNVGALLNKDLAVEFPTSWQRPAAIIGLWCRSFTLCLDLFWTVNVCVRQHIGITAQ